MPVCANPEKKRIRVTVGDSTVILVVRNYSCSEFEEFMKSRYPMKKRGKVQDNSTAARIKFMDSILTGMECEDENGKPDVVTYIDTETKEQGELNPSVDNWISYVNDSWKASAALALEEMNAEVEEDTLKN